MNARSPRSPDAFLREQGLQPLPWEDVLLRIEQKLTTSEVETFKRLHRAFIAYPTAHTTRAFYEFAAARGLPPLLACFRFDRLAALGSALRAALASRPQGFRALDVGAGGGWLAAWLRAECSAEVSAIDLAPEVRRQLAQQGLAVFADASEALASGRRFDFILCADSLGEIHADEDDWLADPAHADDPGYAEELEARYGFAAKLEELRPLLAPGGEILLYEPAPQAHFWHGAARGLEAEGWTAEVIGPLPAWGLRLTRA